MNNFLEAIFSTGPLLYRIFSFGLFFLVIVWGYWTVQISIKKSPVTKHELQEVMKSFASKFSTTKTSDFPGFMSNMAIIIYDTKNKIRKYILDLGEKNKERISVYLDSSNVFTFSIQDIHGESHILRIDTGLKGIPLNKPFILSYVFGVRKTSSYLKVFVNYEQCGSLELPFIVDFNKISVQGGVIGADINGKNGAKIDIYDITSYNNVPTTEEFEKLVNYLQKKERKACVSFTEKQFMPIGKKK